MLAAFGLDLLINDNILLLGSVTRLKKLDEINPFLK